MVEAPWVRRASMGFAIVAALVAGATAVAGTSAVAGAPPPSWDPPPCDGWPGTGVAASGAWYRLDPTLADGVRVGQRLTLGPSGDGGPVHVDLDAESFASGPYHGTVLVGTDDRAVSSLALLDLGRGCRVAIATAADVVRHAVLTPERGAIVEFRVDRRTRRDLGVWRRPLDGGASTRIVGPIGPDARFGPTWLTTLSWTDDGGTLVIESCGEVACRYRLVDPDRRVARLVADPALGSLIGVVGERLVVRGACRGLPCPVLAVGTRDGRVVTLDGAAGQAVLVRDGGGVPLVVHEIGVDGGAARAVALDGEHVGPVEVPAGQRLVGLTPSSNSAVDLDGGWIVFGPDGRLPLDGTADAHARRIGDEQTVTLDEVVR